jgi:hypothetical protein
MSGNPNRSRASIIVGAALLLFGSVILGMLPAAADSQSTGATHGAATTATTTATTAATQTTTAAPDNRPPPTTTTTTTIPHGPPVAGGIVPCSTLNVDQAISATDTCADMPCPTGANCGVVVAGPTTGLGAGQYVYLNFYDFAPGDSGTTIYYCADPGDLSTLTSTPTCGNTDTDSNAEAPQQVRIYPASTSTIIPQGTSAASMQAAEVSSPSEPISAQQYNPTVDEPGFFCDGTTANACAIVVTDASITPGQPASTSSNSVIIPISFATGTTGCPNATVVSTESEFGIDLLMPELARLSCANDASSAVIPFETATDGLSAITDLASGAQQIAFTDNPESADQQAILKKGGLALIPVALTANVVSFFAQLNFQGNFTLDQMDLTPTMAAGLLTDAANYSGAASTDDVVACSGPSAGTKGDCLFGPGPCFGDSTCSLYSQLNFINGYNEFATFQSVQRSDESGATGQLFNWLCTAPKVPLDFGSQPLESQSGAQELEVGLSPAANLGPPVTVCPEGVEQVPPIAGTQRLITVNDPSQQALKSNQAVFQSGTTTEATAAFADMNWGESRYYGMNVAALQNAAGDFVLPTTASLDAALSDATVNPDGSYTPQNLASDPAAYPMPSVIYAVVPTTPQPAADATAVSDLLTQLLQLTSGSETSDLPDGFVPLPADIAAQSAADITKDIQTAAPPTTTTTTTTAPTTTTTTTTIPGSTTATSTGTGSSDTSDFANGVLGSDLGTFGSDSLISPAALNLAASAVVATTKALGHLHHDAGPLLGPSLPGFALVASHGKALVPEALSVGILAVVLGAVIMSTGVVRRRRSRLALASVADSGPGSDPGPAGEGP